MHPFFSLLLLHKPHTVHISLSRKPSLGAFFTQGQVKCFSYAYPCCNDKFSKLFPPLNLEFFKDKNYVLYY